MVNKKERILKIRCEMTPSHQSDLFDTLMCKFELLAGKEDIIHGDYEYANYQSDYKKDKPLTRIKSFKMDIKNFLEEGGRIESMENKVLFDFPEITINKGNFKNIDYGCFPLFVCEFKQNDINIDVNCYMDYKNLYKDLEEYRKEFPELMECL